MIKYSFSVCGGYHNAGSDGCDDGGGIEKKVQELRYFRSMLDF